VTNGDCHLLHGHAQAHLQAGSNSEAAVGQHWVNLALVFVITGMMQIAELLISCRMKPLFA
jgi:hypothetical protein